MHDLYSELINTCDVLSEDLAKTNQKLEKSGGELSAGDLDYIDKLTHAIKSVETIKAMLEAEDGGFSFDDMSYENGNSMRGSSYNRGHSSSRGRGSNAYRDSMGRYSSRRYSRAGDMVMELRELMDTAPDNMRGEFQRFINKVETM